MTAINWVKVGKWVELTGDSADAVHSRRKAGKWLDGIQCRVADGNLWINIEKAQEWVNSWGAKKGQQG